MKVGTVSLDELSMSDPFIYAGTWNDHSHLIENIPRRYNVPTSQTQLLLKDRYRF